MPNGIGLGLIVFTQWRAQEGGYFTVFRYRPNSHIFSNISRALRPSYKLMRLYYRQLLAASRLVPTGTSHALYFLRCGETQLGKNTPRL